MEVDQESQKRVTIPARVVDAHRQEDIKHLQCKKTREKEIWPEVILQSGSW